MVTCPDCNGQKQVFAFVCGPNVRNSARHINCSVCKGAGEISEVHLGSIRASRELRELRIGGARHLSQHDVALLLNLDVAAYSQVEHGNPELWAQYGERALRVVREQEDTR